MSTTIDPMKGADSLEIKVARAMTGRGVVNFIEFYL